MLSWLRGSGVAKRVPEGLQRRTNRPSTPKIPREPTPWRSGLEATDDRLERKHSVDMATVRVPIPTGEALSIPVQWSGNASTLGSCSWAFRRNPSRNGVVFAGLLLNLSGAAPVVPAINVLPSW